MLNGESEPVRLAKQADQMVVCGSDDRGNKVVLLVDETNSWSVEEGDYRLGLLTAGIGRVKMEKEFVSHHQVLAEGIEADQLIKKALMRIQILQAAKEVGLMEAALDYATEYTANRKAFGQEIAKFQGVSFRIAKMAIETRVANHLLWEAAVKADQESEDAEGLALRAIYRAHKSLRYVTDSAVQLLGGHGFIQEFPVEKWMRDAQTQVALYGRELDYLHRWGKKIVGAKESKVVKAYDFV
ncbi:acyl-CoA dehydrogenase [Piscibacillus salipiscarius]|uniref:acyl-CoA dehydrogenase n=1 Tax=Piscibacillus salipiscarius TaxID=299480 RepID=UPI000B301E8E|nr:acyl-CoA dehydrogenase [Piscibacillus salipiscarius]